MKHRLHVKKSIYVALLFAILMMVTSCGLQGVTSMNGSRLKDGKYSIEIAMEGGSGRAYIESPSVLIVENGQMYATIIWSSKNYDYMIVDGIKYLNEAVDSESTFTIPIKDINEPLSVIADTTAMSKPHEIEYVLTFDIIQDAISFNDLVKTGSIKLEYATKFSIDEYGEYQLINIEGENPYLVVPRLAVIPSDIPDNTTVLNKPLNNTYLVSTSVMDLIRACDSMPYLRFSGTKKEDWSIEEAIDSMEAGKILYAGKYSAPDYELLLNDGCNLAIENTMIYHKPEVKEKLEELGIPVLVEKSSYEEHPLGRLEWIKLYGVLYDRQDVATSYFEHELEIVKPLENAKKLDKSVAFFYITSNGSVNVRKADDYIPQMIRMAGGEYILKETHIEEENALSTMNMQVEDFYLSAKDADILIYNSTIIGEVGSINDILNMSNIFADFKAVKDKEVYCVSRDFFQNSTAIAEFIMDLNKIITGSNEELTYLQKLE